jgi:UPF0716 family protein affecting phage T7 exclusion
MMKKVRSAIQKFRAAPPGERFQGLHQRSDKVASGSLVRSAMLLFSLALIAGGVFFMVAPGPGLLITVLGLALLAAISRRIAALFDHGEVKLRRLWGRVRSR